MSFRNLDNTYQSALDAGKLGSHIMYISFNNLAAVGYNDYAASQTAEYVEYLANESGTDIKCPLNINSRNTTYQWHKRYFPNVKYWNSIQNLSFDAAAIGSPSAEVEVNAKSLVRHNFGFNGTYDPSGSGGNSHLEMYPEDTIYGKFTAISLWETGSANIRAILKLTVGEYV